MTTPIAQNLNVLHSPDGVVDLYILDCSALGGSVFHFSPQCYQNGTLLTWGGQAYNLVPIGIDSMEMKSDSSDLPRVNVTISNAPSGFPVLAAVVSLGDLVGATLTHYMTKVSYLDGQSEPDTTQFVGPHVWKIVQKSQQTNQAITFVAAYPIDLPGFQFPIRQFLIDPGINPGAPGDSAGNPVYFPGVNPMRGSTWMSQ